ncbi:MAG: nucleotide exchange factor GrpE [Lachnospiraceae bacterium]|nr:nucleotide exchange factor GrpE [Lachnospiraceae bacterium]
MSDLAAKKKTKTKAEEVQNEKEIAEETAETTAETTEGEAPGDNEAVEATEAEGGEENVKDKNKEKIDELEDKVKRQLAEFENFRKRTEKEKATMFEAGAKSVIEKILPVIDNFERGLATTKEEDKTNPHVEGMNMIYKQLMTELDKLEVKPIEAVGQEFNPDFHNAIMQVESDEYESGIIAQELLKGYTYRDSVIRHSMVAVVS